MCFNRKVLIGLGVVALGVLVFAQGAFFAVLPVLVLLACPLSMVFMMRSMAGSTDRNVTPDPTPVNPATDAELAALRAEVDQLRAQLSDRERAEPSA